mgnify:FL=1
MANNKIFKVNEIKCERSKFDNEFVCKLLGKKDKTIISEKDVEFLFVVKKEDKQGNLISSAWSNEISTQVSHFNKICSIVRSKPILDDDKKILIESKKEIVCANNKEVLKKYIEEKTI